MGVRPQWREYMARDWLQTQKPCDRSRRACAYFYSWLLLSVSWPLAYPSTTSMTTHDTLSREFWSSASWPSPSAHCCMSVAEAM